MNAFTRASIMTLLIASAIGCKRPDAEGDAKADAINNGSGAKGGLELGGPAPRGPGGSGISAIAPDGLPVVIPSPGSSPPSVGEWNEVTREVTVRGSSAMGCETKMVREWLRVSCRPKGSRTPTSVKTESSSGQQAYVGMFGTTASVVVQVVSGKLYTARFTWDDKGLASNATLFVEWPKGSERPMFTIR